MKLSFGPKRLAMTSGVLVCAMGTGYLMQNVLAGGSNYETSGVAVASVNSQGFSPRFDIQNDVSSRQNFFPENAQIAPVESEAEDVETILVDDVVLTSALPKPPVAASHPVALPNTPVKVVALSDAPISDLPMEEKAPAFACEIEMTAKPEVAAMAVLELQASCLTNARFTVHHNGMMISGITDEKGYWRATLPALGENALFIAAFPNGDGAVANVQIKDLSAYNRYVVQWKGDADIQMHAFEDGATYEAPGHVWRENSRDREDGLSGDAGFLTRFAENDLTESLNAEIYTFPLRQDASVDVNIEIQVGDAACNQDVEAQALIMSGAENLEARDLMIAMPDCGAVGEFLVLKNLYEDLTIARN